MRVRRSYTAAALVLGTGAPILIVAVLFILSAPSISQASPANQEIDPCGYGFRIDVIPPLPIQSDIITVTYSAVWPYTPTPEHQSHQVIGNVIRLDAIHYVPEMGLPVISGWGGTVGLGTLSTGTYTAAVYLTKVVSPTVFPPELCGTKVFTVYQGLLGVELGPNHIYQTNAGRTIVYDHVLTNTGTTTDTYAVEFASTRHWPTELMGGDYSTGTPVLPLQVGPQMTASLQLSLTIPPAAGGTDVTVITATSMRNPTVWDTATNTTTVFHAIHLPLVLRNWPPKIPSGRVALEDGRGLAGVGIYVHARCDPSPYGGLVATTDQNGYYWAEIDCTPVDESYTVFAALEGYTFTPSYACGRIYAFHCESVRIQVDFVASPVHTPTH